MLAHTCTYANICARCRIMLVQTHKHEHQHVYALTVFIYSTQILHFSFVGTLCWAPLWGAMVGVGLGCELGFGWG